MANYSLAIEKRFPKSLVLWCAWHRSLNFKKRFLPLARGTTDDKRIHKLIVNLPFSDSVERFDANYKEILQYISANEDKKYLEDYYALRKKWAKCFIMHFPTCGIYTTQRVESIHAILQKELSTRTSLQEVLTFLKDREFKVDHTIQEETDMRLEKKSAKALSNVKIFTELREILSEYVVEKMKLQYQEALNYSVVDIAPNKEW